MKVKIDPLKVLAIASTMASELIESSQDGVITLPEILDMGLKIAAQIGVPVDTTGFKLTKIS